MLQLQIPNLDKHKCRQNTKYRQDTKCRQNTNVGKIQNFNILAGIYTYMHNCIYVHTRGHAHLPACINMYICIMHKHILVYLVKLAGNHYFKNKFQMLGYPFINQNPTNKYIKVSCCHA